MSQLSRISLENYKAFHKKADISIRPLTLFFGYNSAGKSAALRFLQLLSESTNSNRTDPLNLTSEVLKSADFATLLSKYSSSPRMTVHLGFGDVSASFTIRDLPDLRKQVVERIVINGGEGALNPTLEWVASDQGIGVEPQAYKLYQNSIASDVKLTFDGLTPVGQSEELKELLAPITYAMSSFGKSFISLSPDCIMPARYELEVAPAANVSRRGEGMMSMLQEASETVIQDISAWYQIATGYSFQRQPISVGNRTGHRFTLHPNNDSNIDIDIIDTGEGMGQVLPVVALLTLAKYGNFGHAPIISLEHPELHIHPDAHVHLAELFCSAASSNTETRLLVETHSENLLLGIQLAIVEGTIDPTDVAIHWVRGTKEGAVVELIELDDKARPKNDNWPIDVFRTNSKLARDLFDKRSAL